MGSWAQNSSGVRWCRRRVRFNEVPEKVPEKVPGSLGAKPSQVHQGSGEGSGEGLGGYLVQARRVLQGSANSCPIDAPVFSWACFFSPVCVFFCKFGICQISISFLEQGTVGNFIESWIYRDYYCSTCRPFELEEMTNLFIDACNLLVACDAPIHGCTADERNRKVLIVAQLQAEGCLYHYSMFLLDLFIIFCNWLGLAHAVFFALYKIKLQVRVVSRRPLAPHWDGRLWCRARSGSTGSWRRFRRRFQEAFGAKPSQVQRVPEKVPALGFLARFRKICKK